jgi:hypothetical protein
VPALLIGKKRGFMKKEIDELEDELRPEYDFSNMTGSVRGKYVEKSFSQYDFQSSKALKPLGTSRK